MSYNKEEDHRPFTAVIWRPKRSAAVMKNVYIGVNSGGVALHCHSTSQKVVHETVIPDIQFHSVDYALDGAIYAIGWDDYCLRVFDETTKSMISALTPGNGERMGHSSRVTSAKFISPFLLASGGWDKNAFIWDLRSNQIVKAFNGPQIRGNTIDVVGDLLIAGSYHHKKQIQIYSIA
jgi:WD40 repeat protein